MKFGIYIRFDGDIKSTIGSSTWEVPPINKLGKVHVVVTYLYPLDMANQGPYHVVVVASRDRTLLTLDLQGLFTTSITFNARQYKVVGS